jgi:hypothetical protein
VEEKVGADRDPIPLIFCSQSEREGLKESKTTNELLQNRRRNFVWRFAFVVGAVGAGN